MYKSKEDVITLNSITVANYTTINKSPESFWRTALEIRVSQTATIVMQLARDGELLLGYNPSYIKANSCHIFTHFTFVRVYNYRQYCIAQREEELNTSL